MSYKDQEMLTDALGQLIPQWYNPETEKFEPLGALKVQLSGNKALDTMIYTRFGVLAGGGTGEVICDLPGEECELQSLTVGTNNAGAQIRIITYKEDGSQNGNLRIASKNGTSVIYPTPQAIQDNSAGENDFWRIAVYDTGGNYVVCMKRPFKANNGLKIMVYNWDSVERNIAVNAAVARYKK